MLTAEEREIFDIYESLSDEEAASLSDEEYNEYESMLERESTETIPDDYDDERLAVEVEIDAEDAKKQGAIEQVEREGAGRILASGADVATTFVGDLFSPSRNVKSVDEYARQLEESQSLSHTDPNVSLFGGIVRDPVTIPMTMMGGPIAEGVGALGGAIGAGMKVLPKIASKIPSWIPGVAKGALRSGAEGAIEEVGTGMLRGDANMGGVATGAGISALAGGLAGPLVQHGFSKFKELIPNRAIDTFKDADLRDTYDEIGGVFDYDLPSRLGKIKGEQSVLGAQKRKGYQEASDLLKDSPKRDQWMVESSSKIKTSQAFDEEMANIAEQVNQKTLSPDHASEYAGKLADVKVQYFDNIDDYIPQVSVNKSGRRSAKGISGENINDFNELSDNLATVKDKMATKSKGQTSVDRKVAHAMGSTLQDDIMKLFNARISMDVDLKRAYGKAGKGVKLTTDESANLYGRKLLNTQIDNTLESLNNMLVKSGDPIAMKAMKKITEVLEKTDKLPSLYRQEEIIRSIGGGRISKATPSMTSSDLKQLFVPASGIRSRQAGEALADPMIQRTAKEATYRNEEAPLFGGRKKK